MSQFQAKVKSVLSGDTLVLVNPRGAERTLSLAYISAPRLRREGDEPFAFQSREYIRELLVGKVVNCETLYTIPTTKREYGRARLSTGTDLPDAIVAEGWAKVREDAGKKDAEDASAYLEKLRDLENRARTSAKGLWASAGEKLETLYDVPDARSLLEQHKDTKIDAIVERVLTGDRIIARLMLTPVKHVQTLVVLAGIRAPATKRTNSDGSESQGEPFGQQAHQFVEDRLNQRKCTVQLYGVTPQGQLIGSAIHPRGNIAIFLLEAGLARCNDQHVTMLGNEMGEFRQAEKLAKDAKRALFAGHAVRPKGAADTDYIVSRIMNADTIFIRTRAGSEKKISLSSIRQPKPTDPKQSPFSAEAKEYLRKRLIGKHAKVSIDGKKPASDGYEEREVATVTLNDKNVALALVEAGYASVIRHRRDDDDRSPEYDSMLLAEETAQKEGKGMWASKPPAVKSYQDYSESLQKAKKEASVLQRQKRVPAVVDFVKSASRFTILVPRDNAKLTFVLSGIRAPRSARTPNETSEPFGQEAHDFASRRCMQRDVEIDVENTDKVGGFIGTMYVGRENFARVLVEDGLAEVHAYSAEQSGHGNELFLAEKKAKEGRKGIWHDWDPSKDVDEEETAVNGTNHATEDASLVSQPRTDYKDVMVSHIDENGKLKVQLVGPGTAALSELMIAFKAFHMNKVNDQPLPGPPKVGEIIAAKFTVDNEWYRARVRRVDRDAKKVEVQYLDYGNSEIIPWNRLRPLSQSQFTTQKLKPQAVDAALSYIQLPGAPQYLSESVAYLGEQTEGRQLVANVDFTAPDGVMYLTLVDTKVNPSFKIEESINAEAIREGLAMVPRKLKAWERAAGKTLENLKELEKEASREHRGMWEYGDVTGDD
ncbi:MAG: hypothetical protein Q9227_004423 [Pyrenula ochraceoflavens]